MKRIALTLFSMMLFCTNSVQILPVMAEEETQFVVKAVDKATYTPLVSNVFSRYQIKNAAGTV